VLEKPCRTTRVIAPLYRFSSQSIWRLYAGCSLVQRSYVMNMQVMSFCVR